MMMTNKLPSNMCSAAMVQDLIQLDCAVTAGNHPAPSAYSAIQSASAHNEARQDKRPSAARYGKAQRV